MIIVTGTKRSGTSLWMQILVAARFQVFGEAFPREWETHLKDANPDGFYESVLRDGIYFATNPHPVTGAYFSPQEVKAHAVKVFIPGLLKTDLIYLDKTLVTIRPWREYETSLERMYLMEEEARNTEREKLGLEDALQPRLPAHLEWWQENYMLVRDLVMRKYPVFINTFDGLLDDPEKTITQTLQWIGCGDTLKAIPVVNPSNRTQKESDSNAAGEHAEIFDELYDILHHRKDLTSVFLEKLNEVEAVLGPQYREAVKALHKTVRKQRAVDQEKLAEIEATKEPDPDTPSNGDSVE